MPLPKEQLAALREGIQAHELRIAELRSTIRSAEDEIGLHEALIELVGAEWFAPELGELYEDSDLFDKLAENPPGYLEERSLSLPEGLTLVGVLSRKEPSTRVTAFLGYGDWNVEAIWDHAAGFYARPRRGSRDAGSPYSQAQS